MRILTIVRLEKIKHSVSETTLCLVTSWHDWMILMFQCQSWVLKWLCIRAKVLIEFFHICPGTTKIVLCGRIYVTDQHKAVRDCEVEGISHDFHFFKCSTKHGFPCELTGWMSYELAWAVRPMLATTGGAVEIHSTGGRKNKYAKLQDGFAQMQSD